MVGSNILLWALHWHMSAFATVEIGSFFLVSIHCSIAGLVGFEIGAFLGRAFPLPVFLGVDVAEG